MQANQAEILEQHSQAQQQHQQLQIITAPPPKKQRQKNQVRSSKTASPYHLHQKQERPKVPSHIEVGSSSDESCRRIKCKDLVGKKVNLCKLSSAGSTTPPLCSAAIHVSLSRSVSPPQIESRAVTRRWARYVGRLLLGRRIHVVPRHSSVALGERSHYQRLPSGLRRRVQGGGGCALPLCGAGCYDRRH